MSNDIWIPIAVILVIYVVSVIVVIVRSSSKHNKETIKREKFTICNVCGHLISENEVECPYCHQIIKKENKEVI
jgi:flagellar basal body-associated protein FliL